MASNTKQVIIGNSGAGLSALKAIREIDPRCPITVITEQGERAYSPVLTTYYIAGRVPKTKLYITDRAFYRDLGVKLIIRKRAVGVDAASQKVTLDDGSTIEYDNLLIATGASAKRPSIPGGDLPMVRTLRSLEDAEAIRKLARKGARDVVVLGAGLVSLQTADALYCDGMNLTFLVASHQVLSQNVDRSCAEIIAKRLEERKAAILFGTDAQGIEKHKGGMVVITTTGEKLPADIVIVGKGVDPNTQLAQGSSLSFNRGILVDGYMRTNVPNIYAAGDAAEAPSLLSEAREVVATWYNARHQGRIAGMNMAGRQEPFSGGLNRNITSVFGATVASVGDVRGAEPGLEEVVIHQPAEGVYRKLLLRDNILQGAVLMGYIKDAGAALSLIQKQVRIPLRGHLPEKYFMNLRGLYLTSVNPIR